MQFIYDSGSFDAAAAAAAEKSALEKREERRRKEKEVRELEEAAAMVAHKARGTKPEEAKDPNSPMKKKTAGELAKRRRELLQKHSMEGQTAKALQTESDDCMLLSLGEVAGVERSTAGLESKSQAKGKHVELGLEC